ncbi:MAG TPA: hypothetical protein VNM15_04605 [Candidatus Binatia bacterium]|nr:hypothetical protein [Candidatus Binatia bacterium]
MKRNMLACVACACLLASSVIGASQSHGQTRELELDRILNPLPDYDPFERSAATPQYFPDEVDRRARELLIDALTHRKEALGEHLKFFQAQDARLEKERRTSTGLAERAQDLLNNTIGERERYLAAQKEALRNAATPERRKYLEAIMNRDDLNQSEQLMRQSSTNFWGGLANRLLSSVDLVGVASGNYIGAAAETTISQLYALMERDMPVEERRALARNLDHLKRFPDDPRNAEVRKEIESLEKKKKAALVGKQLDRAREALKKNDFQRALFHADLASFLDPASKDVEKVRAEAEASLRRIEEAKRKSLQAAVEPKRDAGEREDAKLLLQALSLRDANQIQRAAIDVEKRHPGTRLADAARDAEAVALERKGWHEAAKKALEQIANSSPYPETKERIAALLQSPEYDLLTSFREARSERNLQTVKYVLLGDDFLRKNLLFAAGAFAAAGPAGAATLGMANALMLTNNIYRVYMDNPVSAQPVIDAGVAYVRSHPHEENAAEIYRVLGDLFEERGMIDKALSYHEMAGSAPEKIAALKEKSAKALLHAASRTPERASKEYYLTNLIDRYPGTPMAAEATKKLADLAKEENQGLRMSKQFLMENPELYGPRGLGLKATLFDGDPRNMEVADRGINLVNDNEILVYYQTPWGVRSQTYFLNKSTAERFFVALREKNQQVALADVNQRAKDSVGGIKNLPPAVVRGDREVRRARTEDGEDTTLTLIREAGASGAYPKVLDFQLLSENERDPQSKYKLPPIQGSISANRFSMSGALPAGLWGNQLNIGGDSRSAFAGVQLPIPLLEGFVPVDFLVQGRPGGVSLYPRIRTSADTGADSELYR